MIHQIFLPLLITMLPPTHSPDSPFQLQEADFLPMLSMFSCCMIRYTIFTLYSFLFFIDHNPGMQFIIFSYPYSSYQFPPLSKDSSPVFSIFYAAGLSVDLHFFIPFFKMSVTQDMTVHRWFPLPINIPPSPEIFLFLYYILPTTLHFAFEL